MSIINSRSNGWRTVRLSASIFSVILFRYQLRAVLVRLALTWPALALVYLTFDLGDQGRRLAASVGWSKALLSSLLHLPLVGVQVLPAALLLAALLAYFRLRQTGELEAMAAVGASPLRWLQPLLAAGLLATATSLLLGELLSPRCERRADHLIGVQRTSPLTGEGPPSGWLRQGRWFVQLSPKPDGRTGLIGLEHDGAYRVRRELVAELAAGGDKVTSQLPRTLALSRLGRSAPQNGLDELRARPETLSATRLHRRVLRLRDSGRDRPAEELLLHSRFAFPCLNLLVALIAWTIVLRGGGRALLLHLLGALLWLLFLFVLLALGWLLARAGWISPLLGAWSPLAAGLLLAGLAALRSAASETP